MTTDSRRPPQFTRLHIEPVGGAAGDMLLAALLDLGADRAAVDAALNSIGIDGLSLEVERVESSGVAAMRVRSIATAPEPAHRHHADIVAIIERADVSPPARHLALKIFDLLVEAEARVHGGTPGEVHLHEVGQLDSILDVLGIAVALDSLGVPPATCSPLPSGRGTVNTAHGVLEVPVPAVCAIAERFNVPLEPAALDGETVTPTGIAVIAAACGGFEPTPTVPPTAIGTGAGTRQFSGRPNVLRVYGYSDAPTLETDSD